MLGRVLDRADEPQRLGAVDARRGDDVDERHLALGDRAGLVEDDRVDAARRLEHLRALDQDAELRAAARADEERGRRREAERARARDDQDGDGGGEREGQPGAAADPVAERADGDRDHDRDEDAGDAVGEALHRRLPRLRVGDEPRDLRERGVRADALGPDDEPAADVDGRAGDRVADADLDGNALAGEERLVDGGVALDDGAVGRDLLAGADDEEVADLQLLDRDAPLAAVGRRGRTLPSRRARRARAALLRRCASRAPRSSGRRAGT